MNFIVFVKYKQIACLQRTQKKLGEAHVHHWVTSTFLLITLCNRLGTEDMNCCSFATGIFPHSWCIQDLSCSTVCGRRCLILLFMMHHTFSIGDRSGLQARPVKHTHSMPTKPRCCNSCRMRPGIVLLNLEFLGRVIVLMAVYISPKFQHKPQCINGTFIDMQITHAVGTDAPPYHHRGWF